MTPIEAAAQRLERAKNAVADAALELLDDSADATTTVRAARTMIEYYLAEPVKEWKAATENFLAVASSNEMTACDDDCPVCRIEGR